MKTKREWLLQVSISCISLAVLIAIFVIGCHVEAAETSDDGLSYVLRSGATYYESSFGFGSGRQGIASDIAVGINGFAYLDAEGNVLLSNYEKGETNIIIPRAPEGAAQLMNHVCNEHGDIGWIRFYEINSKKPTIAR